jgi:hypothetical protein
VLGEGFSRINCQLRSRLVSRAPPPHFTELEEYGT